jgi:methylated-DNA-[protein]-cysteine S-methyltransferase
MGLYKYFVENTVVGDLTVTADDNAVIKITFNIDRQNNAEIKNVDPIKLFTEELREYLGGYRKSFTTPFSAAGTEFQLKVWQKLLEIPYGETRSYENIAEHAGNTFGCRAVGMACKRNILPILIPCHRIVGKNGGLGGYFGGVDKKIALLQLEGVIISQRQSWL